MKTALNSSFCAVTADPGDRTVEKRMSAVSRRAHNRIPRFAFGSRDHLCLPCKALWSHPCLPPALRDSLPQALRLVLTAARGEVERVKKRRGGWGRRDLLFSPPAPLPTRPFITGPSFSACAAFSKNEAERLGRACGQATN